MYGEPSCCLLVTWSQTDRQITWSLVYELSLLRFWARDMERVRTYNFGLGPHIPTGQVT